MNILFFLTPKSEVAYVEETDTLRQALEKMEHHGYAAVPLLSTEGKYLGTLTDGDVLWGLKELNFPSLYQMEEAVRNVGEISNKGIELALNFTPIRTKEVEWDLGVTFSKNWSEVKKLWNEGDKPVTEYVLQTAYSVNFVAKVGEPLGVFQVPAIATVQDKNSPHYGKTIVDANGIPTTSNSEMKTIGSSSPDFTMGLSTSLKYKGFTLSAVADWRKGGYMYSYTAQLMHPLLRFE